ncbi:hypothetical protein L1I30_07155 [Gillisia sp. M10.2A]|uniref:Uncharacterized protein n=1 Tax=Gillisia lutea TaxID=2909668 RepID=A0ABS9EGP2_9FLAO|nr:hypothetical protein [Gillisia lutea]MCF4101437.1 hypothetical protein [Gillisia lutea]
MNLIFCLGVFTIVTSNLQAQNSTAFELNEYLSVNATNKSSLNLKSKEATSTPLQVLAYDLVPTVYIENGDIKVFDEQNPVKAEVTINSFQLLSSSNKLFKSVELLVIKLDSESQISSSLDFSKLSGFDNLKFVYFLCPFNCSKSQIENIAQGLPTGITLLYSASIPE